jgi:hypothetical protein
MVVIIESVLSPICLPKASVANTLTILCCPISGNSLPQDIGSLSPDDVIIIVQGHNTTPIKAKALAYYNFENLKELVVFNDKNE